MGPAEAASKGWDTKRGFKCSYLMEKSSTTCCLSLYFPASLLIMDRKLKGVPGFPRCLFSPSSPLHPLPFS